VVVKAAAAQLDREALAGFKVAVVGASGGVGKRCVEVLVEQGVPVRALVRDPAKARGVLPGGSLVEVVKADVFQYATLPGALGDANAIICATGPTDRLNPLGPFEVDFQGTSNLVALARQRALRKFVHVTSIGTDDMLAPLNLFWGILFWKKRGEEELQRSGLDYTVVRPGGLKSELKEGEVAGNVVMKPPGYYGVPPRGKAGSVLRRQVAEVCVAALYEPAASNSVVEVIAETSAPDLPYPGLFEGARL